MDVECDVSPYGLGSVPYVENLRSTNGNGKAVRQQDMGRAGSDACPGKTALVPWALEQAVSRCFSGLFHLMLLDLVAFVSRSSYNDGLS